SAGVQGKLRIAGNGIYGLALVDKTFADLKGHWAEEDVTLLASKLLAEGTPEGTFVPDADITRAEFAALLTRALGLRPMTFADDSTTFRDVDADDWFADQVATAAEAGLILGFENGEFRPDASITREEMSVMLLRALKALGAETASLGEAAGSAEAESPGFADWSDVSGWALESAEAVVDAGLMQGRADRSFDPHASASRAEAAVVLKRLLQVVDHID
ncbi:MAG: S-layer protein, partial [Paenibacillus sp.]|nr:S-layer protein [Paenibacillus sp.]